MVCLSLVVTLATPTPGLIDETVITRMCLRPKMNQPHRQRLFVRDANADWSPLADLQVCRAGNAGNGVLLKHSPNITGSALALQQLFVDIGLPKHLVTTPRHR
jgi:hypothetical protein